MNRLWLVLAGMIVCAPAYAQVVYGPAAIHGGTIDGVTITNSNIAGGSSTVTPLGATTGLSAAALASQQGVLLDAFKLPGDADDTASITRAVAAGGCALLGPKTYQVHDYVMAGTPASFCLKGVPGQSIIQRTSASGSVFFQIKATNVLIDGVTFDANSGSVTANQWGVLLNQGGQNVTVRNSVFKNNSGTLGSCFALNSTGPAAGGSFSFTANEVTNCTTNSALFGSVSNGLIAHNFIHDTAGSGIVVSSSSAASATNYASDVIVQANRVYRSAITGIAIGGLGTPFIFGTPAAVNVSAVDNDLQDNAIYAITLQGDYLAANGNHVTQSSSSVSILGGIDVLSRYGKVQNNTVTFAGINYGIDIGGSQGMQVTGNIVTMNQGAAYNTGGNLNSVIRDNIANLSGTAIGLVNYSMEGTGGGGFFPTFSSNTTIENNTFNMVGNTTQGIQMLDNAGGGFGALANTVRGNHFNVSGSGANPTQDIVWYGSPASLLISGNTHNGTNQNFLDPNAGGRISVDNVFFGGTIVGISSTLNIVQIGTPTIETYGAGGSILWVSPANAGGSGYVSATTTLAASGTGGGSGWTGVPLISQGAIIGVKTTAKGSGYSGTITVTATDSSGGSGATFTVGNFPLLPNSATLTMKSATSHLLLKGGAFIANNIPFPYALDSLTWVTLQSLYGGAFWGVTGYTPPTVAIGSLPTCNATSNGVLYYVTGSTSGAWQARCNGTNWIAPSGSTIS